MILWSVIKQTVCVFVVNVVLSQPATENPKRWGDSAHTNVPLPTVLKWNKAAPLKIV